jgi:serum/glucocorticoid-regulated kinase 2
MYRKILSDPLRFPDGMGSEARDLLTQLLNRDPAKRLGVRGAQDIRNHPFFSRHIDFKKLWQKKLQPPFKPSVVSHFPAWMHNVEESRECNETDGRHLQLIRPTLTRSSHRKYPSIRSLMIPISRRLFNSNCTYTPLYYKLTSSEGFSWSVSPLGESVGRY